MRQKAALCECVFGEAGLLHGGGRYEGRDPCLRNLAFHWPGWIILCVWKSGCIEEKKCSRKSKLNLLENCAGVWVYLCDCFSLWALCTAFGCAFDPVDCTCEREAHGPAEPKAG